MHQWNLVSKCIRFPFIAFQTKHYIAWSMEPWEYWSTFQNWLILWQISITSHMLAIDMSSDLISPTICCIASIYWNFRTKYMIHTTHYIILFFTYLKLVLVIQPENHVVILQWLFCLFTYKTVRVWILAANFTSVSRKRQGGGEHVKVVCWPKMCLF